MLTPKLKKLRDALNVKGIVKRTAEQDLIFAELNDLDKAMDEAAKKGHFPLIEEFSRKANANYPVQGPAGGKCPTCGGDW